MGTLKTPFGEIAITVDGNTIPYCIQEEKESKEVCPDVLGRKHIIITIVPDGKEHEMTCAFEPCCTYKRTPESGEHLECQSFYSESHQKMSIGLECDEAVYLENGLSYKIPKDSKREQYVFGVCWIDGVRWNDQNGESQKRDIQTWFGADPSLAL